MILLFLWLFMDVVIVDLKFVNLLEKRECFKVKIIVLKCYYVYLNSGIIELN